MIKKNKKHIDQIFKEKLKNYEAIPDDTVWASIEADLNKNKKERKVIPLWLKLSGVAAALLLTFILGYNYLNESDNKNPSSIVDSPDNSNETSPLNSTKQNNRTDDSQILRIEEINDEEKLVEENTILSEEDSPANKYKNSQSFKLANSSTSNTEENTKSNTKLSSTPVSSEITLNIKQDNTIKVSPNDTNNKDAIAQTLNQLEEDEQTKQDSLQHSVVLNNSIEEALANAKNNDSIPIETGKIKRWSISTSVAPVYFNSLGEGSSLDTQFNQNSKTGNINLSYGVNVSYAINDKLRIRTGLNQLNLGYNTNDVIVYNSASALSLNEAKLSTVNYALNASTVSFISVNPKFAPSNDIMPLNSKGQIDQELGFIEVPFELEYQFVDKKFGMSLIGGFSTLFLNSNEVFTIVDNQKSLLGQANNLNDTSFSANFGLGVHYKFSPTFQFNLEPTFKYQINTFISTSGNFSPYIIGVYSGIKYKF